MEENFWSDNKNTAPVLQEIKVIKNNLNSFCELEKKYEEVGILIEMAIEEDEDSLIPEIESEFKTFIKLFESKNLESLFKGEYDNRNAIVSLNAGAGGTESCDWVSMLFRMYSRWAQNKGYKMEVLDSLDGDEAGIKSITFSIEGFNSFGYLKSEKGVHRLVRISPFDSGGRRHTSFASCDIMPIFDESDKIEINSEDLRIDTYRSSGAGGQHVNTTDSAIRITHIPTGIVVQCQNERSQHKNKDTAMKMLVSKLVELNESKKSDELADIRGEQKDISFGSQIRSYVFHPYNMVKDHRTNEETGNVQSVMDGNIDNFIEAYLRQGDK